MKPWTLLLVGGLGCYATASQVLFVTEFMAVFAGNELCLGIIFACWFLGIVAGAFLGGRLAARAGDRIRALLACSVALVVALPALTLLLRGWRSLWGVAAGEIPGLELLLGAGVFLVSPFSLLVGLSFPLACAYVTSERKDLTIGRVYVGESAGAILGALCVSVVLAGRAAPLESMGVLALPLLAGLLGSLHAGNAGTRKVQPAGLALAAALVALVVFLLSGAAGRIDVRMAGMRFAGLETGDTRVAWADTPYQHLDLGEREGQYTLYADGKVSATFPDAYASPLRAHLVMTEHPSPGRILVLGNASFEFLAPALLHPVRSIDFVEIDPRVVELVRPHLDPGTRAALSDARVRLHESDGRRFLASANLTWDLIFSDAPDPATAALNRFYTLEFFRLVQSRLEPGGVFVTRVSSSINVLGGETAALIRTIQATLEGAFSHVLVLPGQETFFVATDEPDVVLDDPARLGDRFEERNIRTTGFTRHHFRILFESDLVGDLQQQLARQDPLLRNTDERPVTYLQSVLRWSHLHDDAVSTPLRWLVSVPTWCWFVLAALLAVVAALAVLRPREPATVSYRGALLAVMVAGGVGLALELVLTFSYQAFFGSVYREIGLIVAAFMTGLVAGGIWIQRRLRKRSGSSGLLGCTLLALAAFSAAVPWLHAPGLVHSLPMWAGQVLLLVLVLLAGAGTGILFPLSSHLAVGSGQEVPRAAGILDGMDHLGAAVGAFFVGIILVPTAGRTLSCLLVGLVAGLAGLINLAASRRAPATRR